MKIGCSSLKLSRLSAVHALFGHKISLVLPFLSVFQKKDYDIYCGWGYGKQSLKAKKIADDLNKKFIYLEDGFIRSVFTSSISKEPLSLVADSVAPYYDYRHITDLEKLINHRCLSFEETEKALIAKEYFINHKLSKFCFKEYPQGKKIPVGFCDGAILIIDQVFGDLSLSYGGVTAQTPHLLFDYIKNNHPQSTIYLKLHPEVLSGKKKGCFDFLHSYPNVVCITDCDLSDLLIFKPQLFVLTSLAGFEAVLHGCKVNSFGLPWYSGYGITHDKHPQAPELSQRRGKSDILTIFYVAYLEYTQYVCPQTKTKSDYFSVVQFITRVIKHQKMMSGNLIAIGIRPWKRNDIYPWLKTPSNSISFLDKDTKIIKAIKKSPEHSKIICWSYKNKELLTKIQQQYPQVKIIRLEDGFIRSYGLGSDFIPPLSLCFDNNDLYFNAVTDNPSDLKSILKQPINHLCLERAERLQKMITQNHVTKYNTDIISAITVPNNKHIIFVPGQVTQDASLIYGKLPSHIQQDYDLLQQVKKDYPNSYILYKPHPDATSGNRKHGDQYHLCHQFYNQIEVDASVLSCIHVADMVATMTSQVGFDALIRGKKVIAYGSPFYRDFCHNAEKDNPNYPIKSASKTMHLIYSALIEYPIYHDGKSFIAPEEAVSIIIKRKNLVEKSYRYIIVQSKMFRFLYKIKKWVLWMLSNLSLKQK